MLKSVILRAALLSSACSFLLAPELAVAQEVQSFDIPAGELSAGLDVFMRQGGVELIYARDAVNGKTTQGVRGAIEPRQALEHLLAGTGLIVRVDASGALLVAPERTASPTQLDAAQGAASSETEIVVTGTRIRGAPPVSPVIVVSATDMREQGHSNLGDVARAVPQSFGGGVNPGIGLGAPDRDNSNLGGGSSLNLRGLGPDATLTLLNGQRLAYSTSMQAIDISAIPMAAVQRLEIVTDGASALYGSDAVGGVANIILRRDYDGARAEARYGATTQGGGQERQFSFLTGATWSSGGLMAALDTRSIDSIRAGDRDIAAALLDDVDLTPEQEMSMALVSMRQSLSQSLTFEADFLYGTRSSENATALTTSGAIEDNGNFRTSDNESFSASPRLRLELGENWQAALSFNFGQDNLDFSSDQYTAGALTGVYPGHYRNEIAGVEINAEGPIARLPGGDARLALGAGQRENSLDGYLAFNYVGGPNIVSTDFSATRENTYAYAELYAPLIGQSQNLGWAHELSLSAAVRYEDYEAVGDIATPKIGVLYAPIEGLDLSVSWGQSFKAPTLYQAYRGMSARLFPFAWFNSSAAPSDTIVYLDGSNDALEPETADTWTATLTVRPHWLANGRIAISYFHVAYDGRVIQPLYSWDGTLTNPLVANFLVVAPTSGDILDAVGGDLGIIQNYSGAPYDPATVAAIVDGREHNANRQTIEGVDLSVDTRFDLGAGSLSLSGSVAYLESEQQLESGGPIEQLAGRTFRQPHWRGRVTTTWEAGPLTLAGTINHTGGSNNPRFVPADAVDAMTTLDLTAHRRFEIDAFGAQTVDLGLVILNAFDEAPDVIRTLSPYEAPYDSTNFSVAGRYVGVSFGVDW